MVSRTGGIFQGKNPVPRACGVFERNRAYTGEFVNVLRVCRRAMLVLSRSRRFFILGSHQHQRRRWFSEFLKPKLNSLLSRIIYSVHNGTAPRRGYGRPWLWSAGTTPNFYSVHNGTASVREGASGPRSFSQFTIEQRFILYRQFTIEQRRAVR